MLEHSEHSIRRAFIFHDEFYEKANNILTRAKISFGSINDSLKKTMTCKTVKNCGKFDKHINGANPKIKDSLHEGSYHTGTNRRINNDTRETIFIGVHIR